MPTTSCISSTTWPTRRVRSNLAVTGLDRSSKTDLWPASATRVPQVSILRPGTARTSDRTLRVPPVPRLRGPGIAHEPNTPGLASGHEFTHAAKATKKPGFSPCARLYTPSTPGGLSMLARQARALRNAEAAGGFTGCGKTASEEHEVSGHDFSRAVDAANGVRL
jgi:hypothetical protein